MKFGIRELVLLAAIVGLAVATFLYVQKANDRMREKQLQTTTKQEKLREVENAQVKINDLEAKVAELEKAIQFFEGKLPKEGEVQKVLDDVTRAADANSLETRIFKTLRRERNANYYEQLIEMQLSGDFHGFYAFVLKLEQLERLTRVHQMKLEKINTRDGDMQATLQISIFFEPEGPQAVAAGQ